MCWSLMLPHPSSVHYYITIVSVKQLTMQRSKIANVQQFLSFRGVLGESPKENVIRAHVPLDHTKMFCSLELFELTSCLYEPDPYK